MADLQVLDENPLDDLANTTAVSYVMKNGRLYEAATLTEVWPRQRPLATQWWWRVEPADNGGSGRYNRLRLRGVPAMSFGGTCLCASTADFPGWLYDAAK